MPMTIYTHKEYRNLEKATDEYKNAFSSVCRIMAESYRHRDGDKGPGEGGYPYIPNGSCQVFDTLITLKQLLDLKKKYCSIKFLDVGCGPGLIPFLASRIGFYSEGLELNPIWREKGNHVEGFEPILADGLKFEKYKDFDVVYYYCPIKDRTLETQLEEKIEDDMKVGAFVLPFYKASQKIAKDARFKRYRNWNIWEKVAA